MLSQESAIETVRHFAAAISSLGVPLKKVVLFGSFSTNTQHQWSDIDVALISDRFCGIGFFDSELIGGIKIQKAFSIIHTRTYNSKQFTPDVDPFVAEILKTGIEIA